MDYGLEALAILALKNAFYEDFSSLVNAYLKAGVGLGDHALQEQLGETANVYSRNDEAKGDESLNIYVQRLNGSMPGCDTMAEALDMADAREVYLRGRKVFERRDGEWYFVGDYSG